MGKFEMVAARNWAAAEHRKSTDALAQGRGQTATGCFARDLHARLLAASTAYRRAEEGVIAIFTLFMFVVIIILAGIGVDFMRHETLRTELQGTLDRAVLAAANLENTLDAEGVVTDYFEKAGLIEFLDDVKMIPENNGRTMRASVKATVPSIFLHFAGIDDLELSTHSVAQQGIANLEIAMVLDVSGSMADYGRISNLRTAGEEFSEIVFGNSDRDHISVSVIPYSTQVNMGSAILSTLDLKDPHDESACINFEANDFKTATLLFKGNDAGRKYEQTMHFDPFTDRGPNNGLGTETCNPDSNNRALLFSRSESAVTNKIRGLTTDYNTSIDLGVKWGTAVLNAANSPFSAALAKAGDIEQDMSVYPAKATNSNLKVMVVMTDGVNTGQYYIPDQYRTGNSDLYVNTKNDRVSFPSTYRDCSSSLLGWGCRWVDGYYVPETRKYYSEPYGGDDARLLTWPEVWSRFTLRAHAEAREDAAYNSYGVYNSWMNATRKYVSGYEKDNRLLDACQTAKDSKIIVFTIGFEAPRNSISLLKQCASSDSHYFDVDGTELSEAFASIATKVTELRLVE